ncbi:FAD-binding oxidoreductase [uncultured Vagococcus sp.]|uniref:NAD(P)/FAD-dependent oxidoreductase n=1 Tax=uncultured Vagococcus sp. TaxID=189676 RepID=UPI00258334F8|nr:FAD-binding oxidoreductase [uncultured Vagococcus sp.]
MKKRIGIIGAGIVGSTTAYYLAKEGQEITVFDDGVGQATSAAAGIISPWLSQRRNKEWYFLAKEGAKFYHTLIKDLSETTDTAPIYQQTGTLLYKKNPKLLEKLEKLATERKIDAPEIGEIATLTPTEIKTYIPNISIEDDALYISGGAKIDGAALVSALTHEVKSLGNTIISDKVTAIKSIDNQWQVTSNDSDYYFDQLVLASGAWIGDLLRPLNFYVDVRPQKGQLIELDTNLDTTNWPVIMPVGETDIIPFDQGKILIGATHQNEAGFNLEKEPDVLNTLKEQGTSIMKDLANFNIKHTRIGTRAYTSDFSPFFGEISTLPNLLVASGLGSSGLTTGPIIGKTLADWCLEKSTDFENYRSKPNSYIYPN